MATPKPVVVDIPGAAQLSIISDSSERSLQDRRVPTWMILCNLVSKNTTS